jgi:hypothetical protein
MPLITIDFDSLAEPDKLQTQKGVFGLVKSDVITEASQVEHEIAFV